MNLHLTIFLLVVLSLVLIILIKQIKDKKLALQYSLTWMSLIVVLYILVLFPGLLNWISEIVGIAVPVNTLFFFGFLFSLLILYQLTQVISKMSKQIQTLTQEIALLKKEKEENRKL